MKYKTICAIVVNDNGDILLTKRNREPFKGKWALFSGLGESKKGLSPAEGVAEEVRCDLGTNSFKGKLLFSLPVLNDEATDETVIFVGKVIEEEINPDPVFSQEVKWFSTDEIKQIKDMAFEHASIVNKYLDEQNK